MSIFRRLFKVDEKPGSYAYRKKKADELHGKSIKYVTERRNDNDDVVGRGGYITVKDDRLIVDSSGDRVFYCNISEVDCSMLMSGDGVIISGPDLLQDGKHRSITVHFVYHRK